VALQATQSDRTSVKKGDRIQQLQQQIEAGKRVRLSNLYLLSRKKVDLTGSSINRFLASKSIEKQIFLEA
jgi:hypothetical protein